jgi:hypothetical protein
VNSWSSEPVWESVSRREGTLGYQGLHTDRWIEGSHRLRQVLRPHRRHRPSRRQRSAGTRQPGRAAFKSALTFALTCSPFILNLLHRNASKDPKIAACQPVPSLTPFQVSYPSCDRTSQSLSSNEVQNPLPALSGCGLSSRMRPSSNSGPTINVVTALPRRSPSVL